MKSIIFLLLAVPATLIGQPQLYEAADISDPKSVDSQVDDLNIDDLFDSADTGIVEAQEEAVEADELLSTTYPLRISGSVTAKALLAAGPTTLNPITISASGGGSIVASINLDAKPLENLRFYASTSASVSEASFVPGWSFTQFYVDYTLGSLFIRAGRQTWTWGGARIFASPANIISSIGAVPSFKVFVPFLTNGLTFIVFPEDSSPPEDGLGFSNTVLGIKLDQVLGPLRVEFGATYRYQERIDAASSWRFSTGPFELSLDGAIVVPFSEADPTGSILGNIYWGPQGHDFHLFVEYNASDLGATSITQFLGLGTKGSVGGGTYLGLRWMQSLSDWSGQVILGFDTTLDNRLKVEIGLPITYGQTGTYFAINNPDPEERPVALGLQFSVSSSF